MSDFSKFTKPSDKVRVSSLHMATADFSDDTIDNAVKESLIQLKKELGMDVVFVSEFINGKRVFRYVDGSNNGPTIGVGDSDNLEESWCKYVVDGQLPEFIPDARDAMTKYNVPTPPFEIGTHLSIPVQLEGGDIYGTLCCFSFTPNGKVQEKDLSNLKMAARLVSIKVEKSKKNPVTANQPIDFA